MHLGCVMLVGSPSSGKSTLFNRFVSSNNAIVESTKGVTRDRLYGKASWLTKEFTVIDTGGIQLENAPFQQEIRAQVEIAIQEADLILFVVDSKIGLSKDDYFIAKMLYKANKKVFLVVNKIDNVYEVANQADFYKLGFKDVFLVSGAHGIGIGDLLDKIVLTLPEKEEKEYENELTFALIGRPNVGKSSLSNCLLNKQRLIVSDISGTTRDSIDSEFIYNDKHYVLIDTAGLNKRGKIYEAIDKYAAIKSLKAISRAKICLFLLDANVGIIEQDKHVVGYASSLSKGIIIVVNKCDLVAHKLDKNKFSELIRKEFKFLDYAPIIFVSSKNKDNVDEILPLINKVYESYQRRIPTSLLNNIIKDAQDLNPSPNFNHGRLKVLFANQVSIAPPTFVFFCNNPEFAHFSYTRYFENRLREVFDFNGTPIKIIYRSRK